MVPHETKVENGGSPVIRIQRNIRNNVNKRDHIGKRERYDILKTQKWRCARCGEPIHFSKKHGENVAHIDHIHPISKAESYDGYINERKNLQALCERCNLLKSDRILDHCPYCNGLLYVGTLEISDQWNDYDPSDIVRIHICSVCGVFFGDDELNTFREERKI